MDDGDIDILTTTPQRQFLPRCTDVCIKNYYPTIHRRSDKSNYNFSSYAYIVYTCNVLFVFSRRKIKNNTTIPIYIKVDTL